MKVKINQMNVVVYDNKPTMPSNRWYEASTDREVYKSRFNLEMNFLGQFDPVKLRCNLQWPPSQLRRYDFWQKNKDLYENWLNRAHDIQASARAGRIKTSIPALIGIPNQNIKFAGKTGTRFNWQVPVIPSMILAVQEQSATERFWNITWINPIEEMVFVINAQDDYAEVPNKKYAPTSTRVGKVYNQPGDIETGLFMETVQAKIGRKIDDEYEAFKKQVTYLLLEVGTELSKMQVNHMFSQHPEWAARLLQETN